jgi:hypothetical protein
MIIIGEFLFIEKRTSIPSSIKLTYSIHFSPSCCLWMYTKRNATQHECHSDPGIWSSIQISILRVSRKRYIFCRLPLHRKWNEKKTHRVEAYNLPLEITFPSVHHSPKTVNRNASEFVMGTVRLNSGVPTQPRRIHQCQSHSFTQSNQAQFNLWKTSNFLSRFFRTSIDKNLRLSNHLLTK